MMNDLLAAYRSVTQNWGQIQASTLCGCCNCLQIFPPDQIVAGTGLDFNDIDNPEAENRQTALCPHCGSEAVLGNKSGYPIEANFLSRMNEAWFQRTIIRKPAPKG
jgi:hypothetical protein